MLTRLVALSFASSGLAFVLELVLARKFGATPLLDAYRLAQSVFLIGAQMLVHQLLPHVIVPGFTRLRAAAGERAAWSHFAALASALAIASSLAAAILMLPAARHALAPGLHPAAAAALPAFFALIGLAALANVLSGAFAAVLGTYNQFAVALLPPLCINACALAAVAATPADLVTAALGGGTLAGATVALAIHLRTAAAIPTAALLAIPRWSHIRPWLGGILAALITCIAIGHTGNILVQRSLSLQTPGSIALFSYAVRLTTLIYTPAALFGNTRFPALAEALADGDPHAYSTILRAALARTLLLSVPAAAALWLVRHPLVKLLFGAGKLDPSSLANLAEMFGWIALTAPLGAVITLLWKVFAAAGSHIGIVAPSAVALAFLIAILPVYSSRGPESIAIAYALWILVTAAATLIALRFLSPPQPVRK
ncbi:MAG: lipid II flippase MurJ [Bryobacteraceae bacterium]